MYLYKIANISINDCYLLVGRPSPGSLSVLPAVVQSQRAGLSGHLYADRHARDARMRRAGRHQRVHHHSLDGHEDRACGQEVSELHLNSVNHY